MRIHFERRKYHPVRPVNKKWRKSEMDERGIKIIAGGVTAAKGFKAASTAAGIKYKDRRTWL